MITNKTTFDILIEDIQKRLYGRDPYMAGKFATIKELADKELITYGMALHYANIMLPEMEERLQIKTGTYDLFGGKQK